MHDIGSQGANSLIGPEIRDLRNSVSDMSRRVPTTILPPTSFPLVQPRPANPSAGWPNRSSGSPPLVAPRDPSPQTTPAPPTHSYADVIHGGITEFHQAIARNAAACRGKGKGNKSPPTTTASKVATVVEAALPKGPPALTSAASRFYTPRNTPAPHSEHDHIPIR